MYIFLKLFTDTAHGMRTYIRCGPEKNIIAS
jgi:hypothetical protein